MKNLLASRISLLFFAGSVALPIYGEQDKIKIYDTSSERAQCPEGYEDLGRFVESKGFDRRSVKAGVECKKGNKRVPQRQVERAPKKRDAVPQDADQIEVLNEEGKNAECPQGYEKTGTFSNMTFANGKMTSRSGIYCSRTQVRELPPNKL